MSTDEAVTEVELKQYGLKKVASGKVREIFELDGDTLLFVATDRISAYDVILVDGVPGKGALLTQLSAHWFELIAAWLPGLRTHLVSAALPDAVPADARPRLRGRCMQVRRLPVLPLESIVRGYITGSAWAEYRAKGTVHGMPMPPGLRESQRLDTPIWTPSTKAEQGEHDENISKARAAELVGADVAQKLEQASLQLYIKAREYAAERGIIIADTKFEFGLDASTGEVVLVDEVLTPDSSRFWPADGYELGRPQESYDKQYLRDYLTESGLKGKEGVRIPAEVVDMTRKKYLEAYQKLTGRHGL